MLSKWVGTAIAVVLLGLMCGCTIGAWDAEATDGRHKTTWNHGLEISVTGWGIYIGPRQGSVTTIDHDFSAKADGKGEDEDEQVLDVD